MKPVVLVTRRLRLRPLRILDAKAAYEYARHPEVSRFAGFPHPRSAHDTEKFTRSMARQWRRRSPSEWTFAITLRRSGRLIGAVGCWRKVPGVLEIGFSLHPRWWGNRYVPEAARRVVEWAFSSLGADRIEATCWTENVRSAKALRRVGLRREGTMRAYKRYEGELRDHDLYATTRADWAARRRKRLKRGPDAILVQRRAAAALIERGRILMVHHVHDGRDYWTLPGGGVEASESPREAALRELKEETGIRAKADQLLYRRQYRSGGRAVVESCFQVAAEHGRRPALGRDPEIPKDGQILKGLRWVPLARLRNDLQVSRVLRAR